jgi:flavin reductase (DIM6/NTAB) family NADH-FMN oxidoreductase RutF
MAANGGRLVSQPMPETSMTPDDYRAVLRRHASSVVVVTAMGDKPAGTTVTSFTAVSLRPPLVLFCVDRAASAWPVLAVAEHVGVHILRAGQEQLARTFATHGADRFGPGTAWRRGPHGVPLLDGPLAHLVGRVEQRLTAGDHTIIIAEALTGGYVPDDEPALVYHRGRYVSLA